MEETSSLEELNVHSNQEDDEMATASLSEVLASRNKFLEEEELWALCRECCLTLEYVHDCHDLFQSLCISPDTVAFDPEGNVCFLDLDIEPETLYVAPECSGYGENSFKSHLFSLGMTLLFATEYNTGSDDPRAELSDTFTDLLTTLTNDDIGRRPDLDTVIEWCEKALDGESSQEICLKILGLENCGSPGCKDKPVASFQQMTDDLTAYIQSQSGLVQPKLSLPSSPLIPSGYSNNTDQTKAAKTADSKKDVNDNCLSKLTTESKTGKSDKVKAKLTRRDLVLWDASLDEEEMMAAGMDDSLTPRGTRKQQGIMLVDILNSLDRFLDETELWSLCRESVVSLTRKKKHLPAYISPETVMIRETGTIGFKAIPEDKPLEVIYMAPELQQKGILNDKTCLYGLGITLRGAAGGKYSSDLSISDGEALEILLHSFLHGNPSKRPDLNTAFQMCEEFEKVNESKSKQVCQKLYKQTLDKASESQSDPSSRSTQELVEAHHRANNLQQNSWDESEPERSHMSSENTRSLAQGDMTEAEDNIDEIPYDEDVDDTVAPNSAFKPVTDRPIQQQDSVTSSAFKPVAVKAKTSKDPYRVPSAFSSPATHFTPIVIQDLAKTKDSQSDDQINQSTIQSSKETDVVAKLREIKHNLLKHRNPETTGKDVKSSDKLAVSQGHSLVQGETHNSSNVHSDTTDALNQLQSQGQLPSTDVLASVIAEYLKSHLTGPPATKTNFLHNNTIQQDSHHVSTHGNNLPEPNGHQHSTFASSLQSSLSHPPVNVETSSLRSNPHPLTGTISTTSTFSNMTTQHVPHSHQGQFSGYPVNFNSFGQGHVPVSTTNLQGNQLANQHSYSVSTSATSANHGHYNTGLDLPPNSLPVQFTLVQNPITGLMQMVPVNFLPMSHVNRMPTLQGGPQALNTNIMSGRGAQLYNESNILMTNQYRHNQGDIFKTVSENDWIGQAVPVNQNISKSPSGYNYTQEGQGYSSLQDRNAQTVNSPHQQQQRRGDDSQSSSPSPSKDSGICLTQQPSNLPFNKETLMERLLSSQTSAKQKTVSDVLSIIRQEFVEKGLCDSGVEDIAIADYIISLSSLTWETFRCAVTEKYFHLVWTNDVLSNLYDVIGGNKTLEFRSEPKTPLATHSKPIQHRTIDDVDRKRLQSEPEIQVLSQMASIKPTTNQQQGYFQGGVLPSKTTAAQLGVPENSHASVRPRSEMRGIKTVWSETSDSTDNEARDKKRRFKKRCDLDKSKSSSLHNIAIGSESNNITGNSNHTVTSTQNLDSSHPSVFSKNYYKPHSSNNLTTSKPLLVADQGGNHVVSTHVKTVNTVSATNLTHSAPQFASPISSPSASVTSSHSNFQENSVRSFHHHPQQQPSSVSNTFGRYQPSKTPSRHTAYVLPSKPFQDPPTTQPASLLLATREYADSSSSNSPKENREKTMRANQPTVGSHTKKPMDPLQIHQRQGVNGGSSSPHIVPRTPTGKDNSVRSGYQTEQLSNRQSHLIHNERNPTVYDSDTDVNSSAEMRRLASEKPELFDSRNSKVTSPHDKNMAGIFSGNTLVPPRPNSRIDYMDKTIHDCNYLSPTEKSNRLGHFSNFGSNNKQSPNNLHDSSGSLTPPTYQPSNSKTRIDTETNIPYGRSLSAVYTRQSQKPDTGVLVDDAPDPTTMSDLRTRRGSDSSIHLPDTNSALLPYVKKGQVVYHSAMIQLSLTADVDEFIHSIDEEDKMAINKKLANINQEINMQCRQRKKTQKFYKKLNDLSLTAKDSKSNQSVKDQMLRDMTDMTKKLSFLHLCHTHLQMLLAELNGLDPCFLYSLSASDDTQNLTLKAVMENPFLQFRTINTPQAGQMSVLQAGTPKGLMSYLYTSSALSDGYIHQFLLCFRYILTADQLLSFIWHKFRSAQRYKQSDINMVRIQRRSFDLLQFWIEGFYSVDFSRNPKLDKKLENFLQEITESNLEESDNLYSLYAACRMGENTELMLNTEMDVDDEEDQAFFLNLSNPKRSRDERQMEWESFRSLLKRSKSEKEPHGAEMRRSERSVQFSVVDCPAHTLAEQLTLLEQELIHKCHPVHFLNSQYQGVGVALSMPGLRTPSMTRKTDPGQTNKKGLFVGEPVIISYVVRMICHSQELAHWVSAEILSCGSNKSQMNMIIKFLTVANMCRDVRNFATAFSVLDGLENLVVRQLSAWKNISAKHLTLRDELMEAKMKAKSESMWLMTDKDCHVYPTIPSALFAALHVQQAEIGGFTLANRMFKWDKMRSISEVVDQLRIFRDHEYGFKPDREIQDWIRRRLSEYSEQDLHAVASTQDNNFRRHSSSSSLSGTLKRVKDKLQSKKK